MNSTTDRPGSPAPATRDDWQELASDWDSLRNGYGLDDEDEAVLQCVRALSTGQTGPDALLWTLGLVTMAPYIAAVGPGPGVEAQVVETLSAVVRAHDGQACTHDRHPFESYADDLDTQLEQLPDVLDDLIAGHHGPTSAPSRAGFLESWRCPRNVAGFARVALGYVTG
ncbi:hypothetical protein ACH4OW_17605 [Streptomyces sp. NPDC017056]|uniref:hypothetical protein n=1 Tax=Streptomyces sp. NPDC017056 TaxID=3364973 RepID=UPI0037894B2C